ncbi:MAG: PQQ-binding-like beta-propeller repeat protein [Planctomycetaceae bacterium]|nr:PQQ-binding-like beta-propeller repeat protein [Planctomycetaceae bacterium]
MALFRSMPLVLTAICCGAAGCGQAGTNADSSIVPVVTAAEMNSAPAADVLASKRPGEDWPLFLGPRETGVSGETGLLDQWPVAGPPMLWNQKLGEGYAPPSVRCERVVVMHRLRDQEIVECLHAETGESLWKYSYETDFSDPYGYNGGSRCAPILTADRCFTFGPQGKLLCLDLATGARIWENDTTKHWEIPQHFFGAGCTPILEGSMLIVLVGGQPNSGVVAFEAATGKVLWESVGKETWDGVTSDDPGGKPYRWTGEEMLVSYSSPVCATIHGERHLLCLMRQGLVSLDPQNGNLRFRYWFRSRTHESVNAARPVVIGDQIFLSAAYETGSALLKVNPDNQSFQVVKRDKRGMSTHWSTPIALDGHVYGFSGRHEPEARLQCVDLATGELKWDSNGYDEAALANLEQDPVTGKIRDKTTLKAVPFPFYGRGSKILADGKFIVLAERGTLALVKPSTEKLEEISRVQFPQMGYPSWAAPVLSRGRLYLRSESHLVCLDLQKPAGEAASR